jgi:hypothetical protein
LIGIFITSPSSSYNFSASSSNIISSTIKKRKKEERRRKKTRQQYEKRTFLYLLSVQQASAVDQMTEDGFCP